MYEKVNGKVAKARIAPGQEVIARRGAMLGYSGDVRFSPVGMAGMGGAGGMVGRMVAGEHVQMMVAQGHGEVHYGFRGLHIHLVELDGSAPLQAEAKRLMCHDASLQTAVVSVASQGGGGGGGGLGRMLRGAAQGVLTGQGLMTTQITGRGSVALLAHGDVIGLPITPGTVVDPQAYVGHLGNAQLELATALSWRDAVGRGSGEGFQLKIHGQGTVFVQASEQKF